MCNFFFSSVLGLVQDPILHLTTEKGTTQGSIRTVISGAITEDTGDRIISVGETEGFTPGASTTEEDMGITDPTGKTTGRPTAPAGGGHAPAHPREGLLPHGPEAIPGILINHLPTARGGLPLPARPRIIVGWSLPSVNLERRRSRPPRMPGHPRLREITKETSLRSSSFQERGLKMPRHPRDQNRGKM